MSDRHIRLDLADDVATLTIDRPAVMNALSGPALDELIDAVDRVRDEGTARALVLTGAGRAFCAGADLSASAASGIKDPGGGLERWFNPLIDRLCRLPIPVVSAVNGGAVGGGCGLALAADLVIAGRSAYFLAPFVSLGLVPDVGLTWMLPRLVGRARATRMMMLGERIDAEQAHGWGMIYEVVDDAALPDAARALARRLATGPTMALGLMRRAILDGLDQSLGQSLTLERHNQRTAGLTEDFREGVKAFRDKRVPVFKGR